ncbi:hypothetical protein NA57DRAFT_61851 [Rhizodiscina lignyota]|uniref:Uncharacterized protein n=1 Tax=Rhizodiscina lignyota TaxID=1504668 RepID=A0A9P4I4G5_9PEZI|nr:hypothetical protein NA57DRAFT_61851 [Rhizodiscina lignyota]
MTQFAEKKVESRVTRLLKDRELGKANAEADIVNEFLTDYVWDSNVVIRTTWFLRDLYMSSSPGSLYREAFHAAALRSRANQQSLKWMAAEGDNAYGRGLTMLKAALEDPAQVKTDATLAAAFVCGLSELISGFQTKSCLSDNHHHRGRIMLLRMRGVEQLRSPLGSCLYGVFNTKSPDHTRETI